MNSVQNILEKLSDFGNTLKKTYTTLKKTVAEIGIKYNVPYFFCIFDHLKIIIFSADRIIGITQKMTENIEPNTKLIVYQYNARTGKVRRCRTHITWVTFGYY